MPDFDPLDPLFDAFPPTSTDAWETAIRSDLRGTSYEDLLVWDTGEGITLQPYYRADDLDDLTHVDPEATTPPLAATTTDPANAWRIRHDLPDTPEAAATHAADALDRGATDLGLSCAPGALPAALADVPLATTPLHLHGPDAAALASALLDLARRRDVAPAELAGTVGFDPLAALATGQIADPDAAFETAADLVAHATDTFRTLAVDAQPYHDAGATLADELAFTLGALSESLAQGTARGVSLGDAVRALHIVVPVSTSYFLEIAKLRALRFLATDVIEAFAEAADVSLDVEPTDLFVQARTSRRTQTLYGPYVNMLRGTTEAMAAAIGGCDVLQVDPFDVLDTAPSARGARIARNTSLLLQEEAHLDQVADPAAGSYYIEAATDAVASAVWERFQALEAEGGLLTALQNGRVQARIAATRDDRTAAIAHRDRVLVGTNHYPDPSETRSDVLAESADDRTPDPAIEPLPTIRLAKPFEDVRAATERYAAAHDGPPQVALLPMGHRSWRSARATFARNFFGVAGFAIDEPIGFDTADDAIQHAADVKADLLVLCSSDREYPTLTRDIRSAMEAHDLDAPLVIAGNLDAMDDVPAERCIHKGSPLLETLREYQKHLGVV